MAKRWKRRDAKGRFISKERLADQKKARQEFAQLGFIEPKKYRKPTEALKDKLWKAWKIPEPSSLVKKGKYYVYSWRFVGPSGYVRASNAMRTLAAKHPPLITRMLFGTGHGDTADWASTKFDKATRQFQHLAGLSKSQSGQQLLQRGREGEPLYFTIQLINTKKIRISRASKQKKAKR